MAFSPDPDSLVEGKESVHLHLHVHLRFKTPSKIPTFILLIKTYVQLRLNALSCSFYFKEMLTDFTHTILHSAKKLNPKLI